MPRTVTIAHAMVFIYSMLYDSMQFFNTMSILVDSFHSSILITTQYGKIMDRA